MTSSHNPQPQGNMIKRNQFEAILRTALSMDELRFARQAALAWLAHFPGDLPINLLYSQALIKSGHPDQAVQILERICQNDPEYLEAVDALWFAQNYTRILQPSVNSQSKSLPISDTQGWLLALGGNPYQRVDFGGAHGFIQEKSDLVWSKALAKARYALNQGKTAQAEQEILPVLAANPQCPLVTATHLKIMRSRMVESNSGLQILRSLSAYYQQRYPECLIGKIILAESLIDGGQMELGVALLHGVAAQDVTGQVAESLWGKDHPYTDLWQPSLEIPLELPLPASVASALGWNRLPDHVLIATHAPPADAHTAQTETQGIITKTAPALVAMDTVVSEPEKQESETLRSVRDELQRLSAKLNRPSLTQSDGRFPIYVVMTTRQGIQKKYDQSSAGIIETEMLRLVSAVQGQDDWGALLFYADEATILRSEKNKPSRLDRSPTRPNDPWGLKLALHDLDESLKKRGERIGALLIVGGPDVVPFHNLPNPVDDADTEVPSDNPYGTRDENYFIPEWPVGRLPDSLKGGSLQPLLYSLSGITTHHQRIARSSDRTAWYRRWWNNLVVRVKNRSALPHSVKQSFGYTAAIWRQASLSVFRPIGEPRAMLISPPLNNPSKSSGANSIGNNGSPLPAARLGYFNLHGLVDAPEWYGQREPGENSLPGIIGDGEDYPIAIRPADVVNSGHTPQVIFTEACYGANILNKSVDEALALKFLQAGTQVVIGSTCISYGAISPPLIAADYLGHAFWSFLREGLSAGEALQRAKISLAREMHNRQGYLDGEDQKTLISFVLYGDPLSIPTGFEKTGKTLARSFRPGFQIKTVCDLAHEDEIGQPLPTDIVDFVKNVVEQYLPGMEGAHLTISNEHIGCASLQQKSAFSFIDSQSSPPHPGVGSHPPYPLARKVVTLSKQVPNCTHMHRHFARLTLSAEGKLVKLVVSR